MSSRSCLQERSSARSIFSKWASLAGVSGGRRSTPITLKFGKNSSRRRPRFPETPVIRIGVLRTESFAPAAGVPDSVPTAIVHSGGFWAGGTGEVAGGEFGSGGRPEDGGGELCCEAGLTGGAFGGCPPIRAPGGGGVCVAGPKYWSLNSA